MDIKFPTQEISWDGSDMPFKELEATKETFYHIEDPLKIKGQLKE